MIQPVTCTECKGEAYVNGNPCTKCLGTGALPLRGDLATLYQMQESLKNLQDTCNDIMDKCKDIFEKVSE